MRLKYCNFINVFPEWVGKYNSAVIVLCKPYFSVRFLYDPQREKIWPNGGQDYKIDNCEATDAFEVL